MLRQLSATDLGVKGMARHVWAAAAGSNSPLQTVASCVGPHLLGGQRLSYVSGPNCGAHCVHRQLLRSKPRHDSAFWPSAVHCRTGVKREGCAGSLAVRWQEGEPTSVAALHVAGSSACT